MRHPVKIKICGITEPKLAEQAVTAGAHYIGVVFHPQSKRHVDLQTAQKVIAATQHAGGEAVAVFVSQTAADINRLCQQLNLNIVQLHGHNAHAAHQQLDPHLTRIYTRSLNSDGELIIDPYFQRNQLNPNNDFLLFDGTNPGSGHAHHHYHFKYSGPFNFFLAGGLNAHNVGSIIQQNRPYAVDVSSGVETTPGVKSLKLIHQFIEAVTC